MNTLNYEVVDAIAWITLDRPKQLNALNLEMVADLGEVTSRAELDPAVRAVVLRSSSDHFMAGGDLGHFRDQLALPPEERSPKFEKLIVDTHLASQRLRRMQKPVLASVRGAAAGFGLSLMLAADLAIVADNAYFTLAYCNIGLSPDGGSTWLLPRAVGMKRAAEIALLGDRFDARQALDWGLVNRVVPLADLAAETEALARRLAAGPTAALGRTKALLNRSFESALAEQMVAEQQAFSVCTTEPNFGEGLDAFFGRRKAAFV